MLPGFCTGLLLGSAGGFGGGDPGPFSVASVFNTTTPGTSFTDAAIDAGPEDANRHFIVSLAWTAGSGRSPTVTVGGVAATFVVGFTNATSACRIFVAAVPTGATVDVVVTAQLDEVGFTTYRAILNSATPIDSGAATNAPAADIEVQVGGVIVGAGMFQGTAAASLTYNGADALVEDMNVVGTRRFLSGSAQTAENATTNDVDISNATQTRRTAAASWLLA